MSEIHYGGQAVLEGVMMRGKGHMAIAVRAPSGVIEVHGEPLPQGVYNSFLGRLPFLRGLTMLWDSLVLGTKALMYSADVSLEGEGQQMSGAVMGGTLALSLTLGIGLFVLAPAFLVGLVDRYLSLGVLGNLVEGLLRLALFVAYLVAIRRMPDIRRVFAYHGAEHKTINAYEAGVSLTPESVQRFSTAHLRCGTSFLLTVLVVFVLLSSLFGRPSLPVRLASRLILVPMVTAIAYEFMKLTARYHDHPVVRAISTPGLALQRLTTEEPDDGMVEVAISALRYVLTEDGVLANGASGNESVNP